jgi:exodeoxyribonuclease VII small subunit
MAESKSKRKPKASGSPTGVDPQWLQEVHQLSYRDAQTALELTLAQLQSSELEVEEMAGLYRRAEAYADRCQAVLESVQQEVTEWSS